MWTFFRLGSWSLRAQTLSNCLPSSTTRMEQLLCSKIYLQAWVGRKIDKKRKLCCSFSIFLPQVHWLGRFLLRILQQRLQQHQILPIQVHWSQEYKHCRIWKKMIAMQALQDFLYSGNEFQPCKTQRNECFRNSSYVLVVVCPRPRFLKVCISTIFKVRGLVN